MKILLLCSAGMSTSLLVNKMQKIAKEVSYEDIEVSADTVESFEDKVDEYDVFLLGPQIKYKEKYVKQLVEGKGKKCECIPPQIYGRMDAKKVLELAINLIK
ncbi:PTS sugar transporter subunit IIB [Clostridium sp. MB40-C1]|uniref:PTS sugar transporter subunit IIB n=1 Tax=Clostridium sp. MB40-C1 TaxID=3070996 RepID=UPI0027DF6B60|nr:PTS sugar transporter subunit IIB [Clostridium sp. MB40-C1]WMJ81736.1 PTS sugar transporter subunit IIB [Clostridium sp. MB40-C1]